MSRVVKGGRLPVSSIVRWLSTSRPEAPMSNEAAQLSESDDAGAATSTTTESTTQPWICRLVIVVCVGIFLGLAAQDDYESWETVSKFGYLPADSIWNGGYWALITSACVHFALWHVAFNVYWLWVLGSRLERAIGSLPFSHSSSFPHSSVRPFNLLYLIVPALGHLAWSTRSSDSCGQHVIDTPIQ